MTDLPTTEDDRQCSWPGWANKIERGPGPLQGVGHAQRAETRPDQAGTRGPPADPGLSGRGWDHQRPHLPPIDPGEAASPPLNTRHTTRTAVKQYQVADALAYVGLRYLLKQRFKDAGLNALLSPHSLRHSFITLALRGARSWCRSNTRLGTAIPPPRCAMPMALMTISLIMSSCRSGRAGAYGIGQPRPRWSFPTKCHNKSASPLCRPPLRVISSVHWA